MFYYGLQKLRRKFQAMEITAVEIVFRGIRDAILSKRITSYISQYIIQFYFAIRFKFYEEIK